MRLACLTVLACCVASADPKLYLKTRVIDTDQARGAMYSKLRASAARLSRTHLIIQLDHSPTREGLDLLAERGVRVLGYIHENGLVVSCDDIAALDGIGVRWIAPFEPVDKVSPLLLDIEEEEVRTVVVEFHPDTALDAERQAVLDCGGEPLTTPGLVVRHLLVRATASTLLAMAARDEVAYIFPAMGSLEAGASVTACEGALTSAGLVAQYLATVGDGWDGPGQGSATLSYFFQNTTPQLPADSVLAEFERALNEWARVAKLSFVPGSNGVTARTISVLFARGAHEDGYAFDGPGGMLAHTFYPSPPNPEPLAGDMHFDEDESWRIGAASDVYTVALHELGHALGLGHSDRPGTVMYPYYARAAGLTPDDIAAIQQLYAAPDAPVSPPAPNPPSLPPPSSPAPSPLALRVQPPPATVMSESIMLLGSVAGGAPPISLAWNSDRGHSGAASAAGSWSLQALLETGTNRITVTATDSRQETDSQSFTVVRQLPAPPVTIQITYPSAGPSFSASQPFTSLRGTAQHGSGIARVTWANDRGGSGIAVGTAQWDTGPIPLQPGSNGITLCATATDGSSTTKATQVNYNALAASSDTTAPALTITAPSNTTLSTSADSIIVRGTAKDSTAVREITWFSSTGANGSAAGTTSWSTPPIPLVRGFNSIVIRAFDTAGNMSWRSVNVTRQ